MSLVRSTLLVSVLLAGSRVLGLARDMLIAGLLGAGPAADAFLAAYRLPDLARKILGEGGLNAGFVPIYATIARASGRQEAARFAGRTLALLALVLVALLALIEIFAAFAVLIFASGLAGAPDTLALAATCTRLAAPLIAGSTLAALLAALLNAEGRFAVAAMAPALVNLVLIGALLAIGAADLSLEARALWLAGAVGASGLLQIVPLAIAARDLLPRRGWFQARRRVAAPASELLRFAALALPAVAASGASQLIVLAATQPASYHPGALAWLYYADRLFQLPLGFVGTALGLVLLPGMARALAGGERGAFLDLQNRALEAALLLSLPAAIALALIAEPAVSVLFARGAFGGQDIGATAAMLTGLAIGLPFAAAGKVLAQGFFARGEAKIPLYAALVGIGVTLASGFALNADFAPFGLGIAATLGFAAHAGLVALLLWRREDWRPDRRFWQRVARGGVASFAMAGTVLAAVWADRAVFGAISSDPSGFLRLAAICGLGLAAYAVSAILCGAVTKADLALLRRPKTGPLA